MTDHTSLYIRGYQLSKWNLLRKAYSTDAIPFDQRGYHAQWLDFVMDCMEEIDLLGYVSAYKRVDDMRREYYDDYE